MRRACLASDGGFQHVSRYARVPRYVSTQEAEAVQPRFRPTFPLHRELQRSSGRSNGGGKGRGLLDASPGFPPPA